MRAKVLLCEVSFYKLYRDLQHLSCTLPETHMAVSLIRTVFFLGVLSNVGKAVGRRINRFTDILVFGIHYPEACGIQDRLNALLEAGVGRSVGQI